MLEFAEFGCGGGAELVAESLAELFVDPEGFGAVAAGSEDPHQQRVAMFSVWGEFDEFAGDAFAWSEF